MSQSSTTDHGSEPGTPESVGKDAAFYHVESTEILAPLGSPLASKAIEDVSRTAALAINRLFDVKDNLHELLQDGNTAEELETCFVDILLFVQAEAGGLLVGREDQEYVMCFVSLFDTAFLSILLNIRRDLLHIASGDELCQSDDMLVCWVDKFFACCWDCVSRMTGRRRQTEGQTDGVFPNLSSYKEVENLRIACQLPQTWQQFPALLKSGHVSPAAKRLALCILFAAFVVRPNLEVCDPWAEVGFTPEYMIECLQSLVEDFAGEARKLAISENKIVIQPLRVAFAMTIALFSSAETAYELRGNGLLSPFQPRTLARLLELLHFIFPPTAQHPATSLEPDELDDAQLILLHWGCSVSWAWEKWDDPRIIGFDVVIALTANWLSHLDKSFPLAFWNRVDARPEPDTFMICPVSEHSLREVVRMNPRSSLIALAHQIHDEGRRGGTFWENNSCFLRLYRTAWCITELVETCSNQLASADLSHVAERLVMFFAELGESNEEPCTKVKAEIVRCLNALKSEVAEKVLLSFHKDIPFFTKLANATGKASRMIASDATGRFLLMPGVPGGFVVLLDFLSLFYKHNATKCLPATSQSFLADLVKFLSQRLGTLALRIALLNCLVHAHGKGHSCESGSLDGTVTADVGTKGNEKSTAPKQRGAWNDEEIYNLALNVVCTDLNLATAFASYVSLTIKKNMDPLLVTEIWDYLRDTLLLFISGCLEEYDDSFIQDGNFASDREWEPSESTTERRTMKILSAIEKICAALGALLQSSNAVVVRLLMETPMTVSLRVSLEKFVGYTGPGGFNVGACAAEMPRSLGEHAKQPDSRVAEVCKRFLAKLKRSEANVTKNT